MFYRIFDTNRDGCLTRDELCKIMKVRMTKKDLESMVDEVGINNDGIVEYKG